jgi:hypothetical protein
MVKKQKPQPGLAIYTDKRGNVEFRADVEHETLWATQAQMASVFEVNVRTVNEHLQNIFKTKELSQSSVIRKFRITAADGKTYETQHYNLDAVLSVGYRVNSKTATQFRQRATKILREHITQGFTINRFRIGQSYEALKRLVAVIHVSIRVLLRWQTI